MKTKSPFKNHNTKHQYLFTESCCYVLAMKLAEHFDLEIWACDEHAVVKTKTGKFLDYDGVYPNLKTLSKKWSGEWGKVDKPKKFFEDWSFEFRKEHQQALRVCRRLIKKHIKDSHKHHFYSASVCV